MDVYETPNSRPVGPRTLHLRVQLPRFLRDDSSSRRPAGTPDHDYFLTLHPVEPLLCVQPPDPYSFPGPGFHTGLPIFFISFDETHVRGADSLSLCYSKNTLTWFHYNSRTGHSTSPPRHRPFILVSLLFLSRDGVGRRFTEGWELRSVGSEEYVLQGARRFGDKETDTVKESDFTGGIPEKV